MKKPDNETNFWISYADLMAGLLFVFILIMTGIIIKLTLLKQDTSKLQNELNSTGQIILTKDKIIEKLKHDLDSMSVQLFQQQGELSEVKKQNALMLIDLNTSEQEKEDLKKQVLLLLSDLNDSKTKLTALEVGLLATSEDLNKLIEAMNRTKRDYVTISAELNSTKQKIKQLTGLKVQIISLLKEKLGNKITIDSKTGALRLVSDILFTQDGFTLKEDAKQYIASVLKQYLGTLLNNPEIKKHIDRIIIEGHTNSDGDYLYNLNLSQKRAYEVMKYILGSELNRDGELEHYLEASGRSYMDLIYDKNGKEDKNASRRIEIKFNLKNEEAIKEIEKILEADNQPKAPN